MGGSSSLDGDEGGGWASDSRSSSTIASMVCCLSRFLYRAFTSANNDGIPFVNADSK